MKAGYGEFMAGWSLKRLAERLKGVEPIPSQKPLLDGLDAKFAALEKAGISTVDELAAALKGSRGPKKASELSGIEEAYLTLLRRALDGMVPKPRLLSEFPGIAEETVEALAALGIKDSGRFYRETLRDSEKASLARKAGLSKKAITELSRLSDLCRIQWVAPAYAKLLLEAGYDCPASVAGADPEELRSAVSAANARLKLSGVELGLKDSQRLVALAAFVGE
jgi:predicted flap endonuclease-1-like 5' DNA nuclease